MLLFGLVAFVAAVYFNDPRIHALGNTGPLGAIHAQIAPAFTKLIDQIAYSGVDVRTEICEALSPGNSVVDLCCGTGLSTPRYKNAIGIDMSPEMLAVAREVNPVAKFVPGNAESWGADDCCDIATVWFAFHEMPKKARARIVNNAIRIARKGVLVVDISSSFVPARCMLMGEPFLLEYLKEIDTQMDDLGFNREEICLNQIAMWYMLL